MWADRQIGPPVRQVMEKLPLYHLQGKISPCGNIMHLLLKLESGKQENQLKVFQVDCKVIIPRGTESGSEIKGFGFDFMYYSNPASCDLPNKSLSLPALSDLVRNPRRPGAPLPTPSYESPPLWAAPRLILAGPRGWAGAPFGAAVARRPPCCRGPASGPAAAYPPFPPSPFPSLPFPSAASSAPPPPLARSADPAGSAGETEAGKRQVSERATPEKEPHRAILSLACAPAQPSPALPCPGTMRPAERACLLLAILAAALLALAPAPTASLPPLNNASSSSGGGGGGNPGKGDSRDPQKVVASLSPPPPPSAGNHSGGGGAQRNPILAMLRDLPALKAAVVGACAASACLMACLLFRVLRSKRRNKKPRKYDIITTPAERVEMAPLNEEDDEDEDATVFDIKYR
ncbi:membrane protein FAM174B [Pantherophis guttatus]|uniref:Membrane protein FAM174B n=1 Tax=Pantherophis guttatus TaxID=94885 RepID=A0A6P9C8Y6_PANGU|nr:membrane protein FAM174B [Pantherophis guttatus]